MEIDPDCDPEEFPCWQHYNGNHSTPITKWVLDLAVSLVSFRIRALAFDQSDEAYVKINDATWALRTLINQRWGNCVRRPFDFYPNDGKGEEVPEATVEAGHSLLQALGFKPKAQPVLRRL